MAPVLGEFVGGNLSQAAHFEEIEAPLTESELLLRARNGDMDAFAELTQRNHGPALVVARSIVDANTAEDVVADSFERLLAALSRGEGPTHSLRPYLLQMVRHRAIDSHRQRREIPLAGIDEPVAAIAEADGESDRVQQAFESLPERWQAALWLSTVEGVSHADIGRELGLNENAVNQLVHRSKEGLRQAYLSVVATSTRQECQPISGLLGKYVRGGCGARAEQRVKAHLETCDACQATVADLTRLNARIGNALAVGVLGGVGLALAREPARAMAAEGIKGALRLSGLLRAVSGIAAGGLVAVGSMTLVPLVGGEAEVSTAMLGQRQVATPVAAASPTPSPTPSTASPTPKPVRTPSTTPQPSTPTPVPPSPNPIGVDVVVGDPTVTWSDSGPDDLILTVPVTAPEAVSLVATISVNGWVEFTQAQSLTISGGWNCTVAEQSEIDAVFTCTADPGSRGALKLIFTNGSGEAACIKVDPVELPELHPADNTAQIGLFTRPPTSSPQK